jgi:hypothetical protein
MFDERYTTMNQAVRLTIFAPLLVLFVFSGEISVARSNRVKRRPALLLTALNLYGEDSAMINFRQYGHIPPREMALLANSD